MRSLLASASLALLLALATGPSVRATIDDPPPVFMKQIYPEQALRPAWEEFKAVMNPKGALDGKTKELIGLAVAAQIPCEYCIYYHTKAAKADGATDAQIKEALASAALVRKWSTMLNGSSYDRQKFQEQVDSIFASH
jgi:AhpD family alkylhydroperoxidase